MENWTNEKQGSTRHLNYYFSKVIFFPVFSPLTSRFFVFHLNQSCFIRAISPCVQAGDKDISTAILLGLSTIVHPPYHAPCKPSRTPVANMAGLSPQITNLVIILGMTQVSKRIPFDDPNVLNGVRAMYIISNLIIAGIYLYVQLQINKKKDMTTLKYVEPAPMGSSEEGKLVTTTVHAYDSQQIKNSFRSQLMGIAMMGVMHLYMKYTNPLLIQSIIPLKGAFESNLVKIHLFGKPASGDLKRPFKQPAGLMSGLQSGPAQSDKKAVEAAERAGRGGVKDE
ncbi:phosphate transport-domain-containing protein [Biscogniauxia mediterranea]|nr:phosphate transport-domain-containing protein [Biscogniauxia mediterranea]